MIKLVLKRSRPLALLKPLGFVTFVAGILCATTPSSGQDTVLDRLVERARNGRKPDSANAIDKESAAAFESTVAAAKQDTPPVPTNSIEPLSKANIPISRTRTADQVKLEHHDGLITLLVRDAPLREVLDLLAQEQGLNLVTAENITAKISITLKNVRLEDALTAMLSVTGYSWTRENNIIVVTSLSAGSKLQPETQGRQIRVFRLDYASAEDVSTAVRGLLSPVGQSFMSRVAAKDNRKTQDLIVAEDLPANLDRIAQYVVQVDQPPRQVLIEAHVLQVTLKNNCNSGVSAVIDKINANVFGKSFRFDMRGFANPGAGQAFFFTLDRDNLQSLVELLQTTTDAKSLASPKVLAINGQEASFQVGKKIGYKTTTVTETSATETVSFLDVGVRLRVTPYISRDNQVLMRVNPDISDGAFNPDSGAPDSTTTNVDTNVLLPDGQGIVIGGLIQEVDSNVQSKVPFLGNLWLVGRLFQQRKATKERQELIITLIPRVVPVDICDHGPDGLAVHRAETPLFQGALQRVPRPWEPSLPDAVENPVFLKELVPRAKLLRARRVEPSNERPQPVDEEPGGVTAASMDDYQKPIILKTVPPTKNLPQ